MTKRPILIYILILLWLAICGIFFSWGTYSLQIYLYIPDWQAIQAVAPILNFGFLISTIVWFVFSFLFIVFAYATFRGDIWAWTSGIIISTIFLVIVGFMLAAFMINAILFLDLFSVLGLVTVIISFMTDIGVVYCLTRPNTKLYFNVQED
jgi:hypothetical protein